MVMVVFGKSYLSKGHLAQASIQNLGDLVVQCKTI